ncbi:MULTISPECIES: TetR/AcrR family transcriptional regulator [unclassified Crossiella]|uniref:TetR/AcrR family transcriptional regulator n=1 Tax=unclassified Crossiella TaxID=2620835 RepID=UPI0020000C5F|nr:MULTISPECIES: TetR/AcrR family transcriptional regulator [unclassified Crossiella]MCK2244482.1 TetR/AcrR family transcriptional regulator [Crossiella sp. S99.2]MCK2258113.1 TetR/AcrR family transcriptional regulator [Crossiella sp. S99.1]
MVADDLREQLLNAAAELLDESGPEAVTIRETARRCGVSHGAPRRHFPARNVLLGHLAKRIAGDLAAKLDHTDETPDRLARGYLDFAVRRPHAFDLLFRHDLLEASGADLRSTTIPLVRRWCVAWLARHPTDTETDALARLVGVHGIASLTAHRAHAALGLSPESLLDRVLATT